MKSDDKSVGHVAEVCSLLARCKVAGTAACERAGMVYSTLHRWRRGSTPKPGQVDKLRRAIMEIAISQATLPEDLVPELAKLRQTVELRPASSEDLAKRVDRLERAVTEHLGAVL